MNEDETIGKVLDSTEQSRVSRRARCVSSNCDRRVELLEERLRDGGNFNGFLRLPNNDSIVELLGDRGGCQVPWLRTVVS